MESKKILTLGSNTPEFNITITINNSNLEMPYFANLIQFMESEKLSKFGTRPMH